MLQKLASGAKAQPASNAVGDLVDQAGAFKPPEMDSEKRAEMFRNIEAQKVQQAQRMADLEKTESPLQEPTPLSEKEVARRISEQPLMERLRGGYEDLKQGLANAAEQPVSFKGLTDFGRALIEPLNKPLFGSERPTPEQLRAQAMRGLQPEPGRQFRGEEVPEQRVWQDAAQRQTFQDVNEQRLKLMAADPRNVDAEGRPMPRLSPEAAADFIEPRLAENQAGSRLTRVSPLERPIGAAPRIEPGTRAGFDVLGEPMLAGGKFVPASSGIPEAPPPHILDRAMDKISRANQKAFIPLMMASEAIPEALEGNYGQAALNVGKGAATLGMLHYLNKTAEAVMNPELRMTMGDFLGSGKKGMEGWRGMAQTYQPSRLARLAPAASNLLNRGFGVLGGLGAAQQLWDDKGASADFMDKYYGGYLGRKALGATAMALGFVPWAGMALGAGDMVGRGIIDPIARKIGPDLSMLGLGSSYNNLGLKEAHGWNVSKEEGGLGQQLPIDDIKAEVRNTLQKAGSLIDPSTGRGTPQYTNMVEGMTKQLMDMGFSKESVVNMYNEVSGGAVKEQPGWLNTKAPSLTELKAQGIDPNAFATGALERYVNRRVNMPPPLPPQLKNLRDMESLGVPVLSSPLAGPPSQGFRPLLPSRRDINF